MEVGDEVSRVGVVLHYVAQQVAVAPGGRGVGVVVHLDGDFYEIVGQCGSQVGQQAGEFLEHHVDLGLVGHEHPHLRGAFAVSGRARGAHGVAKHMGLLVKLHIVLPCVGE